MEHRFTNPYSLECNGLTERFNSTLAKILSPFIPKIAFTNWEKNIPAVVFAHNTSIHATLLEIPYFLGRKAMATPYRHRDRKPMSYNIGRNYEARTTKFGTHVDQYRVIGPKNFLEHRSIASYFLKTTKLN